MAEKKELSFNKKVGLAKLILSSLFARELPYLILDGDKPNLMIFSNIVPDRVRFYQQDMDDFISVVKLSDGMAEILYEVYPILRNTTCVLDLRKFNSATNKKMTQDKGVPAQVNVNQDNDQITVDVVDDSDAEKLLGGNVDQPSITVVGNLVIPDVFAQYEAIVDRFRTYTDEPPSEYPLTVPGACGSDKISTIKLDLGQDEAGCPVALKLPIKDGRTLVSFREYLSKRNKPWVYTASVQYDKRRKACKVAYLYSDEYVNVMSVAPGTLWFPFTYKK